MKWFLVLCSLSCHSPPDVENTLSMVEMASKKACDAAAEEHRDTAARCQEMIVPSGANAEGFLSGARPKNHRMMWADPK